MTIKMFHCGYKDFDKFSNSFNKTGNGKNVYGWGMYFGSFDRAMLFGFNSFSLLNFRCFVDGIEVDFMNKFWGFYQNSDEVSNIDFQDILNKKNWLKEVQELSLDLVEEIEHKYNHLHYILEDYFTTNEDLVYRTFDDKELEESTYERDLEFYNCNKDFLKYAHIVENAKEIIFLPREKDCGILYIVELELPSVLLEYFNRTQFHLLKQRCYAEGIPLDFTIKNSVQEIYDKLEKYFGNDKKVSLLFHRAKIDAIMASCKCDDFGNLNNVYEAVVWDVKKVKVLEKINLFDFFKDFKI